MFPLFFFLVLRSDTFQQFDHDSSSCVSGFPQRSFGTMFPQNSKTEIWQIRSSWGISSKKTYNDNPVVGFGHQKIQNPRSSWNRVLLQRGFCRWPAFVDHENWSNHPNPTSFLSTKWTFFCPLDDGQKYGFSSAADRWRKKSLGTRVDGGTKRYESQH